MSFSVALFRSTSAALRAEGVIQQGGVACKLIPTPRHISSDCGVVLRFGTSQRTEVEALLSQSGVDVVEFCDLPPLLPPKPFPEPLP